MKYRAIALMIVLLSAFAVVPFSTAFVVPEQDRPTLVSAKIVIQIHSFSIPVPPSAPVILALWGDGSGVVSANEHVGGSPYLSFRVPRDKMESVISGLYEDGLFQDGAQEMGNSGYSSARTTITCIHDKGKLCWSSWHELNSVPGKRIVTSAGVGNFRPGSTWLSQMSESSPQYLAYLAKWNELRFKLAVLARNTTPIKGQFVYQDRATVWDGDRLK